jgi:ABC-type antimicrobial peptide transport system permease subunit
MSTGVMAVILTVIIIFAAFFLVLVPTAFVIFYSRKDVAETVLRHDPVERWTDRTPLPVLGASVALFTGAMYMLLVGLTTPMFPFFGRYLTGIPAAACFVGLAVVDVYLALALFRLKSSGWWIAIMVAPVRMLSMILTYRRADLMQAYSKVGISDEQVKMLNANPMFRGHILLWWSLISVVLFFGYLLWLKRYFKETASAQSNALTAQIS